MKMRYFFVFPLRYEDFLPVQEALPSDVSSKVKTTRFLQDH